MIAPTIATTMNATPVKGTHHSLFTYHLLLEAPHRAAPVGGTLPGDPHSDRASPRIHPAGPGRRDVRGAPGDEPRDPAAPQRRAALLDLQPGHPQEGIGAQ